MPEFTQHLPGTFSWPELATNDQDSAVAFYRGLFGWDVDDQPIGPDERYSIFKLRGLEVGAAYTMRAEEKQMGLPPHWNAYVTVANVDQSAERVKTLGGKVIVPPFDVFDMGRMAILQDPTGAVFQIWQANKSIGARLLGEPGSLVWTELTTSDPAAAEKFYVGMFGWKPKHSGPESSIPYTEFTVDGANYPSIGMMAKPPHMPPDMPSFWLPYFLVPDVDAAAEKAKSLGGQIHFGPHDIPGTGRFAVVADPQGAAFSVYTPKQ
jgi:uncharacterized protein